MDYKDLVAWQRAMDLSVPSNIAEGEGRLTTGERRQFLSQARGSLFELETQLIIAQRIGYLDAKDLFTLYDDSRHWLEDYLAYVRRKR